MRPQNKLIFLSVGSFGLLILFAITLVSVYRSLPTRGTGKQERAIKGKLMLPPDFGKSATGSEVQLEITLPIQESEPRKDLPVLLTGIFTLLGSAIVLIFNHIANGAARKFEWAKHIWEAYQAGYMDLRNTISQTTDANLIQKKIETLGSKLFLPVNLEKSLQALLTNLRSSESSSKKEKWVSDFLIDFEAFMRRPWKFL
jgi:hypothetical protein